MKKNTLFLASVALLLISSCGFNKQFYQAEKLPAPPLHFTLLPDNNRRDTAYMDIADNKFQPVYTDRNHQPIDLSYTLESVVFTSKDGNKLNGWFLTPRKIAPNGITLLFLHGNAGNVFSQKEGPMEFVKRGFKVFLVDYSGYGFSEGHSTRKNFLADGNSALDYMLSRPDVKGDKIVIYGQSLGGHLSATVAAENEKKIDALVIEGAPSSHKDIAAHMFRKVGFLARMIVKDVYPAKKSIEHYHKPLLLIYSSEDQVVPIYMGHKLFDNANQPKSFYEVKHPHIFAPEFYADSITYKIKGMVGKQ